MGEMGKARKGVTDTGGFFGNIEPNGRVLWSGVRDAGGVFGNIERNGRFSRSGRDGGGRVFGNIERNGSVFAERAWRRLEGVFGNIERNGGVEMRLEFGRGGNGGAAAEEIKEARRAHPS